MKPGDFFRELDRTDGGVRIFTFGRRYADAAGREWIAGRWYHDGRVVRMHAAAFFRRFEAVRTSGTTRLSAGLATVIGGEE